MPPAPRSRRAVSALGLIAAGLGCNPNTNRPDFGPVTGAMQVELALRVPAATDRLADALAADSIPLNRVERRDGYLESPWFSSTTLKPASRHPMGREVVRVRAWIGPTKPEHSQLVVETTYRPFEDPSLPARELDRQVPPDHPTAQRIQTILTKLNSLYGDSLAIPSPGADSTKKPPPIQAQPSAGQ